MIWFVHIFSLFQFWRSFLSGIPPSRPRPAWTAGSYSPKIRSPNPSLHLSSSLSLSFSHSSLILSPSLRFLALKIAPLVHWIVLLHVGEREITKRRLARDRSKRRWWISVWQLLSMKLSPPTTSSTKCNFYWGPGAGGRAGAGAWPDVLFLATTEPRPTCTRGITDYVIQELKVQSNSQRFTSLYHFLDAWKMTLATHLFLCLLASALSLSPVSAKPAGGIAKFPDIYLPAVSRDTAVSAHINVLLY